MSPPLAPGARVALLTSGGDAPGMNAALRAAWRVGTALGWDVVGVEDGYHGLLEGRVRPLDPRALDEAARRGGTLLGTSRSARFPTAEGQVRAREVLVAERIAGLVVIGGNGSLAGAQTLLDIPGHPLAVAGIPASIDNDLAGTSMALGVDTAVDTIVEACDRIADTAALPTAAFLVEVMGRDCGYLAMAAGVAAGADAVLIPESGRDEAAYVDQVVAAIDAAFRRDVGKRRALVLKSEGVRLDVLRLKAAVDARLGGIDVDTRVTVLGHVVRGGTPSSFDRLLGARLANAAMRALARADGGVMAGWAGPGVAGTPCPDDPYVVLTPIPTVLQQTERLMRGESELGRWRRRTFADIEGILRG